MYLKRIITTNLQSHKEVVIDLPEKGFVVFAGENSNGKSVIVKATRDILSNYIKKPMCRADLVNREASYAEITYIRSDDARLTVHITREAANTYFLYKEAGGEEIVRSLSDKNYMELVQLFRWNTSEETGITLNIAEGDDALLFYKTSYKTNGKVLQAANTDAVAEVVLESFEQTIKDARKFRDDAASKARIISSTINDLKIYDVEALSARRDKLIYYYNILSNVYIPTIPDIKGVPDVRYAEFYEPKLPKIKYPTVLNIQLNVPDILPLADELESLRNSKCPLCGRGFDCAC